MKFVYGKQDFETIERGQENCYLITNGLGGFSSATIVGSNSRNDHSFFMGCIKSPNNRINLVNRLNEELIIEEEHFNISTQEYIEKKKNQEGFIFQNCFCFEDYPEWTYLIKGIEIVKKIAMKQQENTIAVVYQIYNSTEKNADLIITPFFQMTKKGMELDKSQRFFLEESCVSSNGVQLYFKTNGLVNQYPTFYTEDFYYSYDRCDGRNEKGCAASNHNIVFNIKPKTENYFEIIYSMEAIMQTSQAIIKEAVEYRKKLVEQSGISSSIGQMLVKSANQFISNRDSTNGKTILAGYPFFEDWGRDTMIAMTGCCISTKQFETAKSIFRTFIQYCKKGIMPNLFPEGENAPMYNTADASLLFINAIYLYYQSTNDIEFVKETYPIMKEIIKWYQNGTDYGIYADNDGLIMAGKEFDQVTWMDVRIDKILPTPRHGKPVEINAYWYNALKIMERFSVILKEEYIQYENMAAVVKESFIKKFWNEEKRCLKDVLSGTQADLQVRCNQIWAVSMPFTMLSEEKEKQVVETVFEKLYTPYGLRTLEESDPQFHGIYEGKQKERDMAYHQGTIWVYPLGAYYLAYLKIHKNSNKAIQIVKRQLEVLENALREGCVGQLPEIYNGKSPVFSKGCFAQAWSVGEILRVYEIIEQLEVTENESKRMESVF